MSITHTVVIGGGVVGTSAAYYLAKQGSEVTLLEQGELASGCSQGNAGQVTPGHLPLPQPGTMWRNLRWLFKSTSPLFVAPRLDLSLIKWLWSFNQACNEPHLRRATRILCELGEASATLFDQLVDDIGLRYQNKGRLEICRSEKTFLAACEEAELLRECGFESRRLCGDQVQQFEPAIQTDVAGAIYYPNSGFCNPQELVKQFAAAAAVSGAKFKLNTPVTDLRIEQGRVVAVITPQEEIKADAVVLACGSWAPRLAQRLGMRLPVQPGKGYHLDIERPEASPAMPVVLVEERIFVTPIDDFLRLAGTMEFSGFNLRQRPARVEMLAAGASRYLPGVPQAPERSRWCHLRPMTPDGLPIIGRVPHIQNVWIATGHGMLGVTQGPITGKLVAEWISEGRTSLDLTALRPERFQKSGRNPKKNGVPDAA
ncbi:MAG: FAD-dependent oxidoreductase [Planctomycetia bacterium]|nr:FAD-dependent oxidoreductase [Planctomycetia bacterium]